MRNSPRCCSRHAAAEQVPQSTKSTLCIMAVFVYKGLCLLQLCIIVTSLPSMTICAYHALCVAQWQMGNSCMLLCSVSLYLPYCPSICFYLVVFCFCSGSRALNFVSCTVRVVPCCLGSSLHKGALLQQVMQTRQH